MSVDCRPGCRPAYHRSSLKRRGGDEVREMPISTGDVLRERRREGSVFCCGEESRGVDIQGLGNGAVAELGQTRLEHIDPLQNCALALRQKYNSNGKK